MHEGDRNLVRRMLAGEPRAFDTFFDAYASRLAAFAARRSAFPAATIEDIVQTTLIKALRNLGSFRGDSALFTWLCGICRNQLVNLHRKELRQPPHESLEQETSEEAVLDLRVPEDADPLLLLELREHRSAIAEALNGLPERYARALEWKYGDGFSVEEIATMLTLTPVAAQSLLARARLAFRRSWAEEGREPIRSSAG